MKTAKCGFCQNRFRLHEYHSDFEKTVCFSCRTYGKWLIRHCGKMVVAATVIEGVRQRIESAVLKEQLK